MSWFRFCSIICAVWGVAFFFLARLGNRIFAYDYVENLRAEDWTRLLGLSLFAVAFVLNAAHTSPNDELKRNVARGVLIFTLGCALLMTYWQVIPDGRWNRLDIANIVLLYLMSYGLFTKSGLLSRK
ncbi:MAG: hypothetical protein FI707_12050 [SAR202 cluster bacterium]|jgi:drug/metabolite transporter (DMT)-like permease|nr:hypothetical protein [SAR202 cluster bacterium]MDP6663068.1 hypothetical protein [SAR202 cluster bacterium]MQG56933.1 hypothetical protein [SAR202 cluster bacterium]MQG69509.1 hypothetical protein [SAR202 cluster bacterium]HAL48488.1 hypothetical protein [Dehalococcoidia bacterium]|tara:strand:- start:3512 stop:3892 length:381 start_codon:yes stop_codon:yes gene_type:complete